MSRTLFGGSQFPVLSFGNKKCCGSGNYPMPRMSKLGLSYVLCTLLWTKKKLDKYSSIYPTYIPRKFALFSNFPHFVRKIKLDLLSLLMASYCLLYPVNQMYYIKTTWINHKYEYYWLHWLWNCYSSLCLFTSGSFLPPSSPGKLKMIIYITLFL